MEAAELLQELKILNERFTAFISSSVQEKARLQSQLDISRERNKSLDKQVAQLQVEVRDLRHLLAEQATRKEELEIVRSIKAQFAQFEETWSSEEAKGLVKDEEEESIALDTEMSKRAFTRELQRSTTRSVGAVPR